MLPEKNRQKLLFAAITLSIVGIILIQEIGGLLPAVRGAATIQNSVPVTSVSAASFIGAPAALTSDSIVAAFGTQLATGTMAATSQPLPTTLLGTTVTVNGVAAPLFFVSAGQVNFLIPPNTPSGDVQVVITSTLGNGDQIVSRGQIKIASIGPSIFTANASGSGVPAAVTGRINAGGQFEFDPSPPFAPDSVNPSQYVPAPIDVGTAARPAFLILYGTGLRNAQPSAVRAVIGGIDVPVAVAPAPEFTGLDQINVQIPLELKGRGNVDVTVVANGVASNSVTVNLAGVQDNNLTINNFDNTPPALAGQTVVIGGAGFSSTAAQNTVIFGSTQARVVSATSTQLSVIVPFGAESGPVTVQTSQGEARSSTAFPVRTSISGIVQSTGSTTTSPAPLEGVTIRVVGTNLSVRTNPQGTFVLPDLPPGVTLIEVDGRTNNANPPYPSVSLKTVVRSNRDNQFSQPISLQQITGGSGVVGGQSIRMGYGENQTQAYFKNLPTRLADLNKKLTGRSGLFVYNGYRQIFSPGNDVSISSRGLRLEIPFTATTRFPSGTDSGVVELTLVEGSRLPGIALPRGIYSSTIAQITPLGTTFSPGASLTFPNPDPANLPPGTELDLYRYDFQSGTFIKRGSATVDGGGTEILTNGRLVDIASFWLVARPGEVTTVTGRVIDLFDFPVSGALVTANGRSSRTDLNGGFSISEVSTTASQIQVEAVLQQQYGTPPRGTSAPTNIVAGGVTNVGTIALNDTNQPGLVLSPFMIDMDSQSQPVPIEVTLTQPAPSGGLQVSLTSDDTNVATVPSSVTIPAGQTTASFNVTRAGSGYAFIDATATLAGNSLSGFAAITVSAAAPVLTSLSAQSLPPGAELTIFGTGLSDIADLNLIGFMRNGNLVAAVDPYTNNVINDNTGKPAVIVRVPPLSPGPVEIVASVIDGSSYVISDESNSLAFTVLESTVKAPQLASVTPTSGNPRDQVTITGTGFDADPLKNYVIFRQNGVDSEATITQSSTTQLQVQVPAFAISMGPATIVARVEDQNGVISNDSNALDFTVNSDPLPPPTPVLTSVVNPATQGSNGKAGDTIFINGTGLGRNYIDPLTSAPGNQHPDISIVAFYQGSNAGFALPTNTNGLGTQLTTIVPTGLIAGPAEISVLTIDLESGLISDESGFINFTVTGSSLPQIDEGEPNDSTAQATQVNIGLQVNGNIASTDPGQITINFDDGSSEVLSDLFVLTLTQARSVEFILNFTESADLDLFVMQVDGQGMISIVDYSASIDTTIETLELDLESGVYYIGVGSFEGATGYTLSIIDPFAGINIQRAVPVRQKPGPEAVSSQFQVSGFKLQRSKKP